MPDPHGTPIQLTERFDAFVRFLGSKGGSHQAEQGIFAGQLAAFWGQPVPVQTLRTVIQRAKQVGVVRATTHGAYIGMGREPDTLHLRFPVEEWPERRAALEAAHTARRHAGAAKAERTRQERERAKRAQRARERAAAPARAWPPPPPKVEPLPRPPAPEPETVAVEELDVEAWAWAGDF